MQPACGRLSFEGWSNLGGTHNDNFYFIGDCPHEWLFQNVAAVVHHGGRIWFAKCNSVQEEASGEGFFVAL
jgi:UDP:flavonoid glycosyltransferase YjiC (YdhE family)